MVKTILNSENRPFDQPIQTFRGEQAQIPLNAAIVGGGNACCNLLKIMDADRLSRLRMKILGVSDRNSSAPGFLYAKELNLFTTTSFHDLYTLKDLNLIIELTGSDRVFEEILKSKPAGVSFIAVSYTHLTLPTILLV